MMIKENWFTPVLDWKLWAFPTVISLLLVILAQYNFLVFHALIELFPIMIAFLMFALAWATYDYSKNLVLLFLACGYLWVGSLDLLHTLSYMGLTLIEDKTSDITVQLWVGTRYLESLLLLSAMLIATKAFNKYSLIIVFGAMALCLTLLVFLGYFPTSFVEGVGLTPFKIISEYIIVGILFMALISLFRLEHSLSHTAKLLVATSIILTMCSELAFTLYSDLYGVSNMVGHIFKFFSFWLIFRAIVLSDLKAPYEALIESRLALEKTLKDLVDQKYVLDHHALVVVTDPTGSITYVNDKFCATSGYRRDELLGQNPRILKSGYHTKEDYQKMWGTIASGKIWNGEICNKAKDGALYWLQTTIAPLTEENGAISQYIAIRTDVSDRKRTEEQLRQTHKMNAVGQLTGGIAHDFNNILGIVLGNLEILQAMAKDDPKALKRIETAYRGAKRGADLTSKLLSFSRTTSSATEIMSVNHSIKHMEELIEKSLTGSITIKNMFADNLWTVDINKGDFEDALLNIAINARDAMPDGGTLLIETKNTVLDAHFVEHNPESKAGEFVVISISDTGIGMSKETMEQALEPFFTTKAANLGTGLGLSMVHGFIQRSGGYMNIYSEVGNGSTFRLYIPRAVEREEVIHSTIHESTPSLPRGSETILVVDDEKDLVKLAKIQLKNLGYDVITTTDTSQAITILQGDQAIDLLFSDIVMPGDFDGYQLALSALKARPEIKILLTSGFTNHREKYINKEDTELLKLAENLLSKPYNHADLAHAIRKTLDDKGV